MSTTSQDHSKGHSNIEPKSRKLLTVWIVVIVTIKILATYTYFILYPSIGLKILLTPDSLIIGPVLIIVIRYYFPNSKNST
jgi:hypothetical protein